MLILLIMILMIFMIVNLSMIISYIFSKKTFKDREKNSLLNVDLTLKIQESTFFPSIFPYWYHIFNFWCSNHSSSTFNLYYWNLKFYNF